MVEKVAFWGVQKGGGGTVNLKILGRGTSTVQNGNFTPPTKLHHKNLDKIIFCYACNDLVSANIEF